MKVGKLIKELLKYDKQKEVWFMKEHTEDDITYAYEIHSVNQRTLNRTDFEDSEFVAVVLAHNEDIN